MSLLKTRIAVTGASTVMGREILGLLAEAGVNVKNVAALKSGHQGGEDVAFGDDHGLDVQPLETYDFSFTQIVLHADEARTTAALSKKLAASGTWLIDGSGVFAFDPTVPVVVPEVNGEACAAAAKQIIANPNSISIFLALALNPLHKNANVTRVVASTYQSVSHWGRQAQDELFSQTKAVFMTQDTKPEFLPKQIAFNCYPMVGTEREDGMSDVEFQTMGMVKKILDTKIRVAVNTVTVPCFVGDGMMVNVECSKEVSPISAALWMAGQTGLAVLEDSDNPPTHNDITGENLTFIARLRDDMSVDNGISFWLMGDNLRKGSAANMVDIATLIAKDL
jgi:aspartate-semialdehyde dehydrogenase